MDDRVPGSSNVLVLGGKWEDKACSFIVPNLLQMTGNYVVTDISGELYKKYGLFFKRNGYDVRCLDLEDPEMDCHYDPLCNARTTHNVRELASSLTAGTVTETQDYAILRAEEELLTALIIYIRRHGEKGNNGLPAILDLLKDAGPDISKETVSRVFSGLDEDDPAARMYEKYTAETPEEIPTLTRKGSWTVPSAGIRATPHKTYTKTAAGRTGCRCLCVRDNILHSVMTGTHTTIYLASLYSYVQVDSTMIPLMPSCICSGTKSDFVCA